MRRCCCEEKREKGGGKHSAPNQSSWRSILGAAAAGIEWWPVRSAGPMVLPAAEHPSSGRCWRVVTEVVRSLHIANNPRFGGNPNKSCKLQGQRCGGVDHQMCGPRSWAPEPCPAPGAPLQRGAWCEQLGGRELLRGSGTVSSHQSRQQRQR